MAQEPAWVEAPDMTTALLAADGADLLDSAAFIDERNNHVSVTFWQTGGLRKRIYRCIDRLNADGESRRSRCALATS